MENGFKECDDPKKLLIPGALPIPVHTIINRTEESESNGNDLPSTIDMDALKGPPPSDTQYLNMNWRRPPRMKPKPEPEPEITIIENNTAPTTIPERIESSPSKANTSFDTPNKIFKHVEQASTSRGTSSGSSSDNEESESSSSSDSSSSSSESSDESDSDNSRSTKSCQSLPRKNGNRKSHGDNASNLSSSSNTNSSSSNSNVGQATSLQIASTTVVVPMSNGESKKSNHTETAKSTFSSKSRSVSRSRSNSSKKSCLISRPANDNKLESIQSIVTKFQKNGVTITRISAPPATSVSNTSVISTAKLSNPNSISITTLTKTPIPQMQSVVGQTSVTSSRKRRSQLGPDELKIENNATSLIAIGGVPQHSNDARQRLPPKKRLVHHTHYQEKDEVLSKLCTPSSTTAKSISTAVSVIHTNSSSPVLKLTNEQPKFSTINVDASIHKGSQRMSKLLQSLGETKNTTGNSILPSTDFVPKEKGNGKRRRSTRIIKKKPSSPKSVKPSPQVSSATFSNKKAAIIESIFSPKRNHASTGIRTKAELKEIKSLPVPATLITTAPIPVPLPPHLLNVTAESLRQGGEVPGGTSEISMTEEEEEDAKRIKLDLDELLETPSKPIEIVDASSLLTDFSISVQESSVTKPIITTPPANGRKRRKVNRTGFPSKKRKTKTKSQYLCMPKRIKPKPKASASTLTTPVLGRTVVDKFSPATPDLANLDGSLDLSNSNEVVSMETESINIASSSSASLPIKRRRGRTPKRRGRWKKAAEESEPMSKELGEHIETPKLVQEIDVLEVAPTHSSAVQSSTKPNNNIPFTPSLTERIKIRKRNSMDGSTSSSSSSARQLTCPGVSPALLNVIDPPIIMPEKTSYLRAGLLSKFYKGVEHGETAETYKEQLIQRLNSKGSVEENGTEDEGRIKVNLVLPPPAYASAYVRERQIDFLLPYNIWCYGVIKANEKVSQWTAEQKQRQKEEMRELRVQEKRRASESAKPKKVQMPDVIPDSWTFKKIRQNMYLGYSKPPVTTEPEEDQLCECVESEFKCSSEDCLNRLVFTECPPACGENCANRKIQKHDWVIDLKKFLTADKGFGVKTVVPIKKASFILEYVGEVVPDAVFKERMHTIYASDTHHYCLQLDGGRVIDGHRSGGLGRFVNHSCEPNCEMQKWSVSGLSRMALFALRDIEPGEELSYDYNFSLYNPSEGQPCHCGSENCRGVIGGRTKQNGGKSDISGTSKRKSVNTKGPHAPKDTVAGGHAEPAVLEKMKLLSRKEKNFVYMHHCFLVRNYEKIRRLRGEVKDKYGDRLEKIMSSWILRFKVGSSKNKPVLLPDEDPNLVRLAHIAQILYELFATVSKAKDESGRYLCEPFMEVPMRRQFPKFHANFENGTKLNGLKSVEKGILRGEYKTIQQLEADIALVLNRFSIAFETEKPEVQNLVPKIKKIYKEQKQKALLALDPFIVSSGNDLNKVGTSATMNVVDTALLPKFVQPTDCDEVIRCICGTYFEEGVMIQCEKCLVWQHCDCMRVPCSNNENIIDGTNRVKRGNSSKRGRKKSISPLKKLVRSPIKVQPIVHNSQSANSSGVTNSVDERENVELEKGIVISVKDELLLLENDTTEENITETLQQTTKAENNAIPDNIHEMETQVISFNDTDEAMETCLEESRNSSTIKEEAEATIETKNEIILGDVKNEEKPYYCELCEPRTLDIEIPLNPPASPPDPNPSEFTVYLTLMREDGFIVRKNDTVYVLRGLPDDKKFLPDGTEVPRKTYLNAGPLIPSECDIFRIDELRKDSNGNRSALGYNYLRPHETFHEPSRRFYPNEILRAPIMEIISLDLIHGRCWVVDSATYCKGRPVECVEEHLYICDLKVDKQARCFSKVGKNHPQTYCTKAFAFRNFETKLKIQRNLHPHGPPSPDFKIRSASNINSSSGNEKSKGRSNKTEEKSKYKYLNSHEAAHIAKMRSDRREKLHKTLDLLHKRLPEFNVDKIDLSHLVTTTRKKINMKICF